jgi:hypothetical protein
MTKIEYIEDNLDQTNTGWWILDYDKLNEEPYGRTGPFVTRLRAMEIWRSSTPNRKTDDLDQEPKGEPSDAEDHS